MPGRNLVAVGWACVALFCALSSREARAGFQPGEFVTHSQDSWGATPSAGNAAQLLAGRFDFVYPAGVEVGFPGLSGFSMLFTSAAATLNYLPGSGANGPLNNDLADPTSSASGEFGGHVLALQLNVDFNDSGDLTGTSSVRFGELVLVNLSELPQYNGFTVRQFLAEQNGVLGAVVGVDSYDAVSFLTHDITRAFQSGAPSQFAQDHLAVPEPSAATAAVAMLAMVLGRRRHRTGNAAA